MPEEDNVLSGLFSLFVTLGLRAPLARGLPPSHSLLLAGEITGGDFPAVSGDRTPSDLGDLTPADLGDLTPADFGDLTAAGFGDFTAEDLGTFCTRRFFLSS